MKSSLLYRNKRIVTIFILSSVILSQVSNLSNFNSRANPVVYWGEHVEQGGILVINQTKYNLSMTFAEVSMEIDSRKFGEEFNLFFDGNYTIYNPNATLSVLIGNPFQGDYGQYYNYKFDEWMYNSVPEYVTLMNDSLRIYVDNKEIPAKLILMNSTFYNEWEEFFGEEFYPSLLVLSNVTLRGYASTKIRYTWNTTISTGGGSSYSNFYYVVGTGRSWGNKTTEKVSYKVYGTQPDFYTDKIEEYFYKECQVEEFDEGKIYTWKWINEEILDSIVGIHYDRTTFFDKFQLYFIVFAPVLLVFLTSVTYYLVKAKLSRRRKK